VDDRHSYFVDREPGNARLLADAAEAAIAARAFGAADQYIAEGVAAEGDSPPWRFRRASLRLAQGRLAEARQLLQALRSDGIGHPAIDHHLAYASFLDGEYQACAKVLESWLCGAHESLARASMATLWLRAMYHLGLADEAWEWIEMNGVGGLDASAAGIAALIALEARRPAAAEMLATAALSRDPGQPEAKIVKGSVLMARGDVEAARRLFAAVTAEHPNQPRGWCMLGSVCMLAAESREARAHFERALALLPGDAATHISMGWACLLDGDLGAAEAAFHDAVALEPASGDAHGGLAVVLALAGRAAVAAKHVNAAGGDADHPAVAHAKAIMAGNAGGAPGLQQLVERLFGMRDDVPAVAAP
jgi:predicted Zn-dependent protease